MVYTLLKDTTFPCFEKYGCNASYNAGKLSSQVTHHVTVNSDSWRSGHTVSLDLCAAGTVHMFHPSPMCVASR